MHRTKAQVRNAVERLLADRQPTATICPSEAARVLEPDAWRPLMPQVRSEVLAMAREGLVEIRQRGEKIQPHAEPKGPIRVASSTAKNTDPQATPDGRYIIVKGRLWRASNPNLPAEAKAALVHELMGARRALRGSRAREMTGSTRAEVDRIKHALGERGAVWWTDGAPDFNRRLVKNTPYRDWFEQLTSRISID